MPQGGVGLGSDALSAAASCLDTAPAPGVSGPAGHPLLSSVSHLLPFDKGHPRVQGLLPGQEREGRGDVSDLQGDERALGGGSRV